MKLLKTFLILLAVMLAILTAVSFSYAADNVDKLVELRDWTALEKVGAKAIPKVIPLLSDKISIDRAKAAELLGKLKAGNAVEPLIQLLTDESLLVVKNAAEALKNITGEGFGTNQEQWRDWLENKKASLHGPPTAGGAKKTEETKPNYDEHGVKRD